MIKAGLYKSDKKQDGTYVINAGWGKCDKNQYG